MNLLKTKTFKGLSAMAVMSAPFVFSACTVAGPETAADLVVYGKVYTANADGRYADAFAVMANTYM